MGTLLAPGEIAALRRALERADYTAEGVLARLGEAGQAGLGRNSTVPAARALEDADDAQATLIRAFVLQQDVPAAALRDALGGAADALVTAGFVDESTTRALVDIRPYGSDDDGASGWVVADLTPGLDGIVPPARPDYVLGVSPASTTLAQMTMRRQVERALDLGTGCGVQALHLARHARQVVATDVNPRALELAAVTAALNGIDVDLRDGSLYEPVAGERFDLIVTNPPYVMSPPAAEADRLTYREGSLAGDGLMRAVVEQAPAHLAPGGTLQVLGNWAIVDAQPWQERLASWIDPTGCDALVLERERLDPYAYIEIWLADAGLVGTPDYAERYQRWLDYFDELGIVGVGMGWISLHQAGRAHPHVQIDEWPHAVQQPVGEAFARHQDGVALAELPDAKLLARRWQLAPDVVQETLGRPGAEDPEHIVLRQQTGFRRAVAVDTALGGVLGACDGELTLAQILGGVASLLDVDLGSLARDIVPRVRQLVVDGLLT